MTDFFFLSADVTENQKKSPKTSIAHLFQKKNFPSKFSKGKKFFSEMEFFYFVPDLGAEGGNFSVGEGRDCKTGNISKKNSKMEKSSFLTMEFFPLRNFRQKKKFFFGKDAQYATLDFFFAF